MWLHVSMGQTSHRIVVAFSVQIRSSGMLGVRLATLCHYLIGYHPANDLRDILITSQDNHTIPRIKAWCPDMNYSQST